MSTDLMTNEGGATGGLLYPGAKPTGLATSQEAQSRIRTFSMLPRVNFCDTSSDLVKEGKITPRHYAFFTSKTEFEDLGDEVFVCVLDAMWAAFWKVDGKYKISNDLNSDGFKLAQELAEQPKTGAFWGLNHLIWLPSKECFATFLLGSKSSRGEYASFDALHMQKASLYHRFVPSDSGRPAFNVPIIKPAIWPASAMVPLPAEIELHQKKFKAGASVVQQTENHESAPIPDADRG